LILAINALQVTMGKENIADTMLTADYWLLSIVLADGCNDIAGIAFAISGPSFRPVDSTFSRTKSAIF